ncbi:MAG: glycosyltransferase family 4 protein [Nitrospirae bacterium]|nr:glycosyltransferase family 4 protein [Nitrospirota bacterium]
MRILVLTPAFLPVVGGAELALFEVYRRLAKRHEVCLVTPVPSPALLRDQATKDYDGLVPFSVERYKDRISFMGIPGHRWTGGMIPPFSLSAVAAIRQAARRFDPDVLNVHYLMPTGLAGVVAEWGLGVPTVVTMNGRDVPGPGVPVLWRWWQRALLRLVTDVTFGSRYCQTALFGEARPRGQVVYNGVEIPPPSGDGASVRQVLGIPAGEPLIFALQRLGPEKRVDVLLYALRHCRDRAGAGILVIGGQGPEEGRLRSLAKKLEIDEQVRFVGYIPQDRLASYFLACDLFAFHSTFETFGIVVAQAMSYGRAVVTVRNTALPEVLGDGGVLVETGDGPAFGDALVRLIHDEALRRRLGEAGRARAEALFNWDRIAAQYEAVLTRAADWRQHAH